MIRQGGLFGEAEDDGSRDSGAEEGLSAGTLDVRPERIGHAAIVYKPTGVCIFNHRRPVAVRAR